MAKKYPFSADKHAHDIELVSNRAYNLAQEALSDKRFDDYDKYIELHQSADEILLAIQSGMVNYKVSMLDGETLNKANELVATAISIRDGISFQYTQKDKSNDLDVQEELSDGNSSFEYYEKVNKLALKEATYENAIEYHSFVKELLFSGERPAETISAINKRFDMVETDAKYVSQVWQTCVSEKNDFIDNINTCIADYKRLSSYVYGVDELKNKISISADEGNTAEVDYLKSMILDSSKSFSKRALGKPYWNDILSLTLFMDRQEVEGIIQKPNTYEELLIACRDFIKNNGLEHYMCKNIDRFASESCYPIEKGSIFTIISATDKVTGEKGFTSAYLTTQGDISKAPNAQVHKYAAQARQSLNKNMESLKKKGAVKEPVFVEYKDMVVLSFLAKMNSPIFESYKKQAVEGKTHLKSSNKELDYDTLKDYEKLKEGVKSFFESGAFKEYLQMCSRFHNYSFHNSLLIWLQKPEATRCASVKVWNSLGRTIKTGSKGIKIYAPCLSKMTDEEKQARGIDKQEDVKALRGFKIVNTFDMSQTEGKPLPSICEELKGTVSQMDSIIKGLENISGIKIGYEDINSGAKGYYSPTEQKIAIKEGMDNLQTIKTAIHETAHSLFDNPQSKYYIPDSPTCDKEVRAESVAFMVATRLGLDTSDYSFAYVSSWSSGKSVEELENNMKHIIKGTNDIFEAINKQIKLVETDDDIRGLQMQSVANNNVSQSATKGNGMRI